MDFIIITILTVGLLILLAIVFRLNMRTIREIQKNEELNNLAVKCPANLNICKSMLKMLGNEKVKVEENIGASTSLYIAISNKITIANTKDNYTRIQTVAHECIHSIQDRVLLLFNFIFSNIYLLYFFTIIVLTVLQLIPNKMLFLTILVLLGVVQYAIRSQLENDAIIRSEYLAKEYMEKEKVLKQEEINKIVENYHHINQFGIKCVNYNLLFNGFIKVCILAIVGVLF